MAVFAYTALSREGKRTSGTLSADNRSAAISQMSRQGLSPVSLNESKDAATAARKAAKMDGATGGPIGRVPGKAIESFTRELSNLLSAGVPLSRALGLLRREAATPAAKELWTRIHDDVVGGTSLAEAMAKYPKAFSAVYVAMVRAGEAGGFLDVVLNQIAEFRARESDLRGKVRGAMVYPIILAILAVGVLIFLLTFFIPRFKGIFSQFGADLPSLTKGIIALSNIVRDYGLYVGAALVVGIVLLKQYIATDNGKRAMERGMLGTPYLGTVIARFGLVRFTRMLGTLVGSGVPLVSALRTARESIGNQTLADTVSSAIEQVQRGESLSKALVGNPKLFPPTVIEMIAVAEETGRLDKELVRLSATYEQDLDRQLRLLVTIAEPAMLFLMAGLIGTIVIGMLLPVFSLSEVVK